jgi:TonB family protein
MKSGRWTAWGAAVALGYLVAPPGARAQNYDFVIDNHGVAVTPVEQPSPSFPGQGIRSGQEGWVRVNFVVTADGRSTDPIIIDSWGGHGFEESARQAVAAWRFEPAEDDHANNTADIRFEIHQGRDAATSNFLRRYRRIMTHIIEQQISDAREVVDQTVELGGWNLYESTMLALLIGRVEAAEGNLAGKLENYRRAMRMGNRNALASDDRRDLLRQLFRIEMDLSQYAAARRTLASLRKEPGSEGDIEQLSERVHELQLAIDSAEPLSASATLYNPCECDQGQPLWSYVPTRRTFSFAGLSGNVERFEVRCKRERLHGVIEAGKRWSLAEEPQHCRIFVFGDDGASFRFVEHDGTESRHAAAPERVARSDVLD